MKQELVGILVAAAVLAVAGKAQTVVLTSDPPGATIFLRGGVEVGQTPLSLQLLSGMPMEITSRWGSLQPVTATVIPRNGQTVVHRFEHVYGTLIVESDREYFRTLRLPLLRGRLFDQHDIFGNTLTVIVDQNFADRFFPNENPIGKQIHDAGPVAERSQFQIVGVVPTIRHDELGTEPRLVQLYFPAGQSAYLQVRMLVRTNGQPNSFLRPIRDAVNAVDPEVPVFEALSMTDALSASLAQQQLAMDLVSAFSLLALVLAVIGLYGILAQTVSQRTREIGVRMAVGASPRRVLELILGKGMLLVGIGLVVGLAAETGLAPLYRSFLYKVTPTDLTTLLLTAAVLGAAAFLGCLAPAWRAANLDPVEAIRER